MEQGCHTAYKSFTDTQEEVLTVENADNLWFSFVIVEIISFQFYFQVNSLKMFITTLKISFSSNPILVFCLLSHIILFLAFSLSVPYFLLLWLLLFLSHYFLLFRNIIKVMPTPKKPMFIIKSSFCKSLMNMFSKQKKSPAPIYHTLVDYRYNLQC